MRFVTADDVINEIIKAYDTDNDGQLTKSEAKSMFKDIYRSQGDKLSSSAVNRIFRVIDSNRNGKMDKNELRKLFF